MVWNPYHAPSKPERGRIIWAKFIDPQGKNRKRRPSVILSSADQIRSESTIVVAIVSTKEAYTNPADRIELPWQNDGHPVTGLRSRCWVICNWIATIKETEIEEYLGIVPPDQMKELLEKISSLDRETPAKQET